MFCINQRLMALKVLRLSLIINSRTNENKLLNVKESESDYIKEEHTFSLGFNIFSLNRRKRKVTFKDHNHFYILIRFKTASSQNIIM